MIETARRWRDIVAAGAISLVTVVVVLCSSKGVVDDTFISLRASLHLGDGDGLVFNLGERVEGFSNLLWTVAMAVPIGLGISPTYAAGYGGLLCAVAAMVRAAQHASRHGGSWWATGLLVAVTPSFWAMSMLGLEGGLYALLLVELLGAVLDDRPRRIGVVGGLLFMTRVESVLLLGPLALVLLLTAPGRTEPRRARLLTAGAVWLAIVATVTALRYAYFRDVMPNSVRAKSGEPFDLAMLTDNFEPGWRYVRDALGSMAAPLALSALGLFVRGRRAAVFALTSFGVAATVAIRNGGDWMPQHRLLTPYVPLLAVSAGIAAGSAVHALRSEAARARWARLAGAGTASLVVGALALAALGLRDRDWTAPTLRLDLDKTEYVDLALALDDHLVDGDIVTVEALGLFSYHAPDAYVHDFLGLTDRHIAGQGTLIPPWGKVDYRYTIDEVRPTVIILHSGYGHFRAMMARTSRDLETAYQLFALCPVTDPTKAFFFVGIAREAVDRLAPPLAPLGLCEVPFPT